MEIKNIQRQAKKKKLISISLKVSEEISNWMKARTISPTKLFVQSAIAMMDKDTDWNNKNKKEVKK